MTPEQKKLSKTIRNLYRKEYNAEVKAGLGTVRGAIYNKFIRVREEKPFKFWALASLAVAGAGLLGFSLPTMAGAYAVAGAFFTAVLPQALTEFSIKRETENKMKADISKGKLVDRYWDQVIQPRQQQEVRRVEEAMFALRGSHIDEDALLNSLKTSFNSTARPAKEGKLLALPEALPASKKQPQDNKPF